MIGQKPISRGESSFGRTVDQRKRFWEDDKSLEDLCLSGAASYLMGTVDSQLMG